MQTLDINSYRIYVSERSDGDTPDLSGDFLRCEQTHSSDIYLREAGSSFVRQKADAIVTNALHQKIAVRVADCNAIALMGKTYFSIIHAGRKGLQSDILGKTLEIFKEKWEEEIRMFIGPSIRACCYEVGQEFENYFDKKYLQVRWEKLYLDMIAIIADTASKYWIQKENITISPKCTYSCKEYFSYRGGDTNARMIVGIEKMF